MRVLKRGALALAILGAAALAAQAQSLEEKKAHKLDSAFLKKADWITDYDQARDTAKKSGKPIFGYFSRSFSP